MITEEGALGIHEALEDQASLVLHCSAFALHSYFLQAKGELKN
jgi:hypothetical protein